MKRKWTYLGAFFPLSAAVATLAAEAAAVADDDQSNLMRTKSGLPQDAKNEKALNPQDGPEGPVAPKPKAPSDAHSNEDSARLNDHDDLDDPPSTGDPGVKVSVPNTDGSMFAPTGSQAGLDFAGGGGGSSSAAIKMVEDSEDDTMDLPTDPDVIPTENPVDPIVPDPADTDAMLILLGGMAEGSGDGAMSVGEVVFDVVDYGPFTVGYGYASYMASGEEGAVAHTFADAAGADLVFTYDFGGSHGDTAYSTTYVLAIDFEGDLSQGADQGNVDWLELLGQGPFAQNMGNEEDAHVSVDGNFSSLALTSETGEGLGPTTEVSALTFNNLGSVLNAWVMGNQSVFSIQAEAQGIDTSTTGTASVFEIEDQFSSVTGVVTIIA
jgi:hypothetical protein